MVQSTSALCSKWLCSKWKCTKAMSKRMSNIYCFSIVNCVRSKLWCLKEINRLIAVLCVTGDTDSTPGLKPILVALLTRRPRAK